MSKRGPKPKKATTVPLTQNWNPPRSLSAAAREAFKHAVDLLRQRGSLDKTDVELVIAYAQTVEVRDVAYDQLQKDGMFVVSDRNNISAHPAEKAHAQACMRLKALAAEMGLTPASAPASPANKTGGTSGVDQWNARLRGGA